MEAHTDNRTVSIFGCTGSVGSAALSIVRASGGRFDVQVLSAHRNVARLAADARAVGARVAVIGDETCYDDLKAALSGTGIEARAGHAALLDSARLPVDCVVMAIVGVAALPVVMASIGAAKILALANKESLVCAGPLVRRALDAAGTTRLVPVDSEHNAIFQIFDAPRRDTIERIALTASGGPFRGWSTAALAAATVEQALNHPTWRMGPKITIDSATLMNKGLEIIEAGHLFDLPQDKIDVLIHPQSIVHGLVSYRDGSTLAQMGMPDMRIPLMYAMSYPQRWENQVPRLDLAAQSTLTFFPPNEALFPALSLARRALGEGLSSCIALNAVNELAVEAFLAGSIGFLDIPRLAEKILSASPRQAITGMEDVMAMDREVRVRAGDHLSRTTTPARNARTG